MADSINAVPKILTGKATASGDVTSVTFSEPFSRIPFVVMTPFNATTPKNWTRACNITEVTNTGFKFVEMVRNQNNTSFIPGTDICIWIAIEMPYSF